MHKMQRNIYLICLNREFKVNIQTVMCGLIIAVQLKTHYIQEPCVIITTFVTKLSHKYQTFIALTDNGRNSNLNKVGHVSLYLPGT